MDLTSTPQPTLGCNMMNQKLPKWTEDGSQHHRSPRVFEASIISLQTAAGSRGWRAAASKRHGSKEEVRDGKLE